MTLAPTETQSPSVLVVIVNYRTSQLTIDCLQSLQDEVERFPSINVAVVDNLSGDHSVEQIQTAIADKNWQSWVSLVSADKNGGYSYGNNVAIRPALASENPPDYVLLLNPDTVIRPNAIASLVQFMEAHPQAGIAGSRLEDPDGTPQRSAFRFPTIWSEFDGGLRLGLVTKLLEKWVVAPPVSKINCRTEWVAGASMIIRREVFKKTGLMDENYFLYFEEVDFCLQSDRRGWECWYVPESRVVHLVGQSSGVTTPTTQPKRLPRYWFESRQRYFVKNHGWGYGLTADTFWLIGYLLWTLRREIEQKPNTDSPYRLQDFWANSLWVKLYSRFLSVNNEDNKKAIASSKSVSTPEKSSLSLWEQIQEDWVAHEKDWTKPGFRAVALQRFGVWRMTVEPKFLRAPFSVLYRFFYRFIRNVYGIELPYTVQLGRRVIIEHQHGIIIHGGTVIGDDCIIRQGVTLGNRYLERPFDAPKLGDRVNIGAGAKILGNVQLGDDVNIGANAVVLCDVESGKTAVGIPAKVINSSVTKNP
jgi:GT2 family glycosyltransferase/serine acetyltransferase